MTSNPARLNRKENPKSFMEVYAPYFIIICIIILVLLIIALIFAMTGVHANTLTGTEANHWQNLEAII